MGYIYAMEYVALNGWRNIWLESDSTSALLSFKNDSLVPISLQNRWHNARRLDVQVISSHNYREGNCFADKLANMGNSLQGEVWCSELPQKVRRDFFRDRFGFPNFRFP